MNTESWLKLIIEDHSDDIWEIPQPVMAIYAMEEPEPDDEEDAPPQEDGEFRYFLIVELRAGNALQRDPGMEEVKKSGPSLQMKFYLTEAERNLPVGTVKTESRDHDDDRDEPLSNCCYFEHHGIINMRLEVIGAVNGGRRLRLSGDTTVNKYLQATPDTHLEAEVTAMMGEPYFPWL